MKVRVSYLVPVVLGVPAAKGFADRILRRKFGAPYKHGHGRRLRCRRKGQVRVACRVFWWIGDAAYKGSVKVWLAKGGSGRIRTRYRLRVKAINEYCLAVGRPRASCVSVVKAKR